MLHQILQDQLEASNINKESKQSETSNKGEESKQSESVETTEESKKSEIPGTTEKSQESETAQSPQVKYSLNFYISNGDAITFFVKYQIYITEFNYIILFILNRLEGDPGLYFPDNS